MQTARSIEDINDPEFEDNILERVQFYPPRTDDRGNALEGGYEITFDGGVMFWIPQKYGVSPVVGDKVRFYGRGFGSPVRGLALNGVVLWYETNEEYDARFRREQAERDAKQYREYIDNTPQREQDIALLPQVFQDHLNKMRANNPKFWQIEPYELFVCKQALVFANALGSVEAIQDFAKLGWEEQLALVPEMDEGHSGNTFGAACQLACVYLHNPDNIKRAHAAMSPLLGCTGAGCHTPEDFPQEVA